MANLIRIKRRASGTADSPASLENAELAFNEVNDVLWYGKGTGGVGGTATSIIAIGGSGAYLNLSGTQTVTGAKTFTGGFDISGATVSGFTTTGAVTIGGDLTVNGTTTTINSTTVSTDDKNIELGATASPSDAGADGGGFTLKGTTDKTILWLDATDSWTYNQNIELAATYAYRIDGVSVLSKTTLGSSVVSSSLTSLGTIGTGVWQGTAVGAAYGGTGYAGGYASGELLIGTSSGGLSKATLTAGTGITITNSSGGITITAQETLSAGDGLDLAAGVFSVDLKANGGLVIESTELALDLGASSITGTLGAGDGGTGQTTYANGQLLIGNTAGGLTKATLTAGANVSITNGDGAITIASTDTTYTAGDGLDLVGTEFSLDIRSGRGLQITSTELDLDDDLATLAGMQTGAATALALLTSTEVAVIDGGTSATATTLALADRLVVNDNGTMVQVALSDLVTFLENGAVSGFDIDGGTY